MINDTIIKVAESYLGKQEIKGNQGFKDKKFEDEMLAVGFRYGWAWCALFCELVWTKAYQQENALIVSEVSELFSPSAVKTLKNFRGKWEVSKTPVKGAVAIWQKYKHGKKHWSGHAAIVDEFTDKVLTTIDGNSNSNGGREGIEVCKVKRKINFGGKKGLVLQGFIIPKKA